MQRAKTYNRDTAIDAAMGLFWKKGYHATSLKDLEAVLDMKPGSIYAAFQSKEALFGLCLDRYFDLSRQTFLDATQTAPSPLTALANFLGQQVEPTENCDACMLVKTLLNATPDDRDICIKVEQYLSDMETEMTAAFTRAQQMGELAPTVDPRRLARRYQSDLTALKIEAHRKLGQDDLRRSARERAAEIEALRH
jgi:AcrR family transcriptional regulator